MEFELIQGSSGALGIFPAPTHQWTLPDGSLWLSFARLPDTHWLRFPGLADFLVSLDGLKVQQFPGEGIDATTLEHLLLNQVLPLAQSLQGELVFHAAAVSLGTEGLAFMGRSGRGKSTLAASFASNGEFFLTDDGLRLTKEGDDYLIQPSHPSIRLWEDSRDALVHADAQLSPPVQYTAKTRVLSDGRLAHREEQLPLRRVYFLGEGVSEDVVVEPMKASDALIGLVNHSFMLDISSGPVIARHFDELSQMVALPIFYRLDYPRRYEWLDRVRDAIRQHALSNQDAT